MKRLLLALVVAIPSWAQYTTVTGTVKDTASCLYQGGSGRAVFVPGAGSTLSLFNNGQPFQTVVPINALDSNGAFSMTLASNTSVTPASSQWRFNFCNQGATVCFAGPTVTITGASQDITTSITSLAGALNCTPPASAGGVNLQTGNYTIVSGDKGKNVVLIGGSGDTAFSKTFTLPAIAAINSTWYTSVANESVRNCGSRLRRPFGQSPYYRDASFRLPRLSAFYNACVMDLLVAAPGGSTIDGSASLRLHFGQGFTIYCDGTNFWTVRGNGLSDDLTTASDMLFAHNTNGSGPFSPVTTRIPIGVDGNFLSIVSGQPAWSGLLRVQSGINNNPGLQYATGTSCTTAASSAATCNTTITWSAAFADTNYGVVCQSLVTQSGGVMAPLTASNTSTTQTVVAFYNSGLNSVSSSTTYACLAFHEN